MTARGCWEGSVWWEKRAEKNWKRGEERERWQEKTEKGHKTEGISEKLAGTARSITPRLNILNYCLL